MSCPKCGTVEDCTSGDLRGEIIGSAWLDDFGQIEDYDSHTFGLADDKPYYCTNCDCDFDTWEEAKAHVESTT